MGVKPQIVEVPMDIARRQRPPLVHWGESLSGSAMLSIDKALSHIDWKPRFGIEEGFRDAYEWWEREGRGLFEFDFGADDAVLAKMQSH